MLSEHSAFPLAWHTHVVYLSYQHHVILGLKEVTHTDIDEFGIRGLTTLSSFPALPSISACLGRVFRRRVLSKHSFVLVFRFLRRMRNTHGAKRQRPLSSCRYVFIGVLPVFYVTLGAMLFRPTCPGDGESIRDASCSTEPEPAWPQGSPKARLYRFRYCRSCRRHQLVLTQLWDRALGSAPLLSSRPSTSSQNATLRLP